MISMTNYAHVYNSGIHVIGEINDSLIGFKALSTAGNIFYTVKLGVMIEEFKAPGETTYYSTK